MAERLRFGIVGCGVIGHTHAEAISRLPEAELAAVADEVAERARELASQYGVASYDDLAEMLDQERLDVVTVATPSGMHGKHACAVMRSRRHVIVEKPMEITRVAIDEMLAVQREAGVKLAVVFQRRFEEASRRARKAIEEGALGRLVLGTAHVPWWRSQRYYDSGAWRGTWALDGGGVLMNQGIHSIDLLQWLMGGVASVYAHTGTLVHQMETEDVAAAVLRFRNGALGTISATTGAYPGMATRIEVLGDEGSAVIEDDRLSVLYLKRDEAEAPGPYGRTFGAQEGSTSGGGAARDPAAVPVGTHGQQFADMIAAIREDRAPAVDGEAARRSVDIILAIYESARTGREVHLP